ncbi:MAG TPA: asparagine synthase (glutamine-hydrolyzing), partial [Thermodesulfobacteriota bacterium]|nr:asparagine synthase (glutamine-hydrolyzing) [Thermodesulfobacteriota bacterium]
MCGVVGALSFQQGSFTVTKSYIVKMRDTMVHRGPDGAGVWVDNDGRVGLGHRRLAIIDLSESAAQPMCNEDGTLWLSFNGEIYNHRDLRKELSECGIHRWKTDHSDTEVVIHAFEQWGIDCLHRFRGMFAFALWDANRRDLWLVRDRIGIKPLYYSIHNGRITFASEIKALLADPDQRREVDETAFYHYLSFLTTPAPQTLFTGIKKLQGGTWLRVKDTGQYQEERYWDVYDQVSCLADMPEKEIKWHLLEQIRASVALRKESDVPVGVFLSGGLDSSANTALFSEGEGKPVKTFSIGYSGDYNSYPNELSYARMMASQVGAEHHELILTVEDLLDFIPRMIHLQDEPIADPV